jgi:RNA polymerase sigma factor (TIGR02999 family)
MEPGDRIEILLQKWADGDVEAFHLLYTHVYSELKRIAHNELRKEPHDPLLQTTGLVHEAFLRLRTTRIDWEDKKQFFAIYSRLMRQILVDFGRRRSSVKRTPITFVPDSPSRLPADILDLNNALDELQRFDEYKARLVELRYFGGLSLEEVASVAGVSLATAKRDWQVARLWLLRRLSGSTA